MKILVNDKSYEVDKGVLREGGNVLPQAVWDLIDLGSRSFHVLHGGRSFRVELVAGDASTKRFTLAVNGSTYDLELKDRYDELLDQLGMTGLSGGTVTELKAPMPGLVIDVVAKAGASVAKGEPLIVLEAMKMENVLKAPADLTVAKVEVSKGDAVEKNQILLRFA